MWSNLFGKLPRSVAAASDLLRSRSRVTETVVPVVGKGEPWTDRAVTLATISELTDRAVGALRPDTAFVEMPNPLVTTAKLGHHLGAATTAQANVIAGSKRGLSRLHLAVGQQTNLDEALIHCLHQLDHRTRRQELRITELESSLAEANRRVSAFEARLG